MLKLYKTDSKGKLRIWEAETQGDSYRIKTGLVTGKMNEAPAVICTPKNIGRSNETTGAEQAVLEIESKYTKKLREGYFKTTEEAQNTKVILPMLAYKMPENFTIDPKKGCHASRKLDGIRCLAHITQDRVNLVTRKNKEILTMPHIEKELSNVYLTYGECVLDGELYLHGESFQNVTKLVKKYRADESEGIEYHIYDIVLENKEPEDRIEQLKSVFSSNSFNKVKYVEQYLVYNLEELQEKYDSFVDDKYEGLMIKMPGEGYQINKRSKSLLKMKSFKSEEFKIVDVIPSAKRPSQGVVVLKTDVGTEFNASLKGTWAERETLLIDKEDYIGNFGTVEFFEWTDGTTPLPRFPVFKGIRLIEDM